MGAQPKPTGTLQYLAASGLVILSFTSLLMFYIGRFTGIENPFELWFVAINVTTFIVYGLDKLLGVLKSKRRVPDYILHVLALTGGFLGGWLGRFIFSHKTNKKEHPVLVPILILSTVVYTVLIFSYAMRNL